MKFVVFAGSLLVIVSCSKQEKKAFLSRADTITTSVMARPDSLRANPSQRTTHATARAATWQYEQTTDGAGSPVYKAILTATNTLRFAYPYTGGSTATLTIRWGNAGTNVYAEVSNGQFNRSFQEGIARVRFDGGKPPVTYALSAAANGRANIVFIDAADGFVKRVRTARTMSMQVEFPGQRVQKIEFSTAGLRWNH